jgi:hypothetical protein
MFKNYKKIKIENSMKYIQAVIDMGNTLILTDKLNEESFTAFVHYAKDTVGNIGNLLNDKSIPCKFNSFLVTLLLSDNNLEVQIKKIIDYLESLGVVYRYR